jgi:hypothetical protein
MTHTNQKLNLHKPATYRIQVQGHLDEDWSSRLGGMAVRVDASQEQDWVTTLDGNLQDQAALAGVLNTLYSLQMPLISVEYVPAES